MSELSAHGRDRPASADPDALRPLRARRAQLAVGALGGAADGRPRRRLGRASGRRSPGSSGAACCGSMKAGRRRRICAVRARRVEVLREGDVRIFGAAAPTDDRRLRAGGVLGPRVRAREAPPAAHHADPAWVSAPRRPACGWRPATCTTRSVRTLDRLGLHVVRRPVPRALRGFGDAARQDRRSGGTSTAIDAEYARVRRPLRRLGADARGRPPTTATRTAFEVYVPMLTEWRRLPYLDPGLPLELLPDGLERRPRRPSCSPISTRCCARRPASTRCTHDPRVRPGTTGPSSRSVERPRRPASRRAPRRPRAGRRRCRPSPGSRCRRAAARPRRSRGRAPGSRPCRR